MLNRLYIHVIPDMSEKSDAGSIKRSERILTSPNASNLLPLLNTAAACKTLRLYNYLDYEYQFVSFSSELGLVVTL